MRESSVVLLCGARADRHSKARYRDCIMTPHHLKMSKCKGMDAGRDVVGVSAPLNLSDKQADNEASSSAA
ncbi:hypothetical protein BGAL_0030g00330 [Botrytis galanthina]|uniref:Uncharacterized protein n=1 Tax=Botrytis galanthina TaxID=278940 RepID=A0A4S8RAG3_9HELO|nr:hypothetical protein BGAL_0030g00330 [Botrytis galanthina]